MRYAELKELSDQDLVHRELSLERQLVTAQFRLYTNQLEDTSQLGKLRRDIARLQTAARERERAQGLARNALRDRYSSSFEPAVTSGGDAADDGFLQGIVDKSDDNQ